MKRKTLILVLLITAACAGSAVTSEPEMTANPVPLTLTATLLPSTPSPSDAATITTTVVAVPMSFVLEQVAQAVRCAPHQYEISIEEADYRLVCLVAAGHSVDVHIQRFPDSVEAQAAFDVIREEKPEHCFWGSPAYEWQFDERPDAAALPMRHQGHAWQVDRWLIVAQAFDDTGYALAPDPMLVSEAVYQAATVQGLFTTPAGQESELSCP